MLLFALGQLFLLTAVNQLALERMGRKITAATRTDLAQNAGQALTQTAGNYATIIERSKSIIELNLGIMAGRVKGVLNGVQNPVPAKIYLTSDFDDGRNAPPDLSESGNYLINRGPDAGSDLPVSYEHPVFGGLSPTSAALEAPHMNGIRQLAPVFPEVFREFVHLIHRAFVCFPDGRYVYYPGHGRFPARYDPRNSHWYRHATQNQDGGEAVVWNMPFADPITGQTLLLAAKPIYTPQAKLAGVVGVSVLLAKVLHVAELTDTWSHQMRSFLVVENRPSLPDRPRLRIIARQTFQDQAPVWSSTPQTEWLTSTDKQGFRELLAQMKTAKIGRKTMPYGQKESVWAFARISGAGYLVIIVPKEVLFKVPDTISTTILGFINDQLLTIGVIGIIVAVLVAFSAFYLARLFTAPLDRIAGTADRLAKGDFSATLDLRLGDERDLVIRAFNRLGPQLENSLTLQKAVELAREVQQNLLPCHTPRVPGLDIAAASIYCDETGGDYYDYFFAEGADQNRLAVVVGDVSGHGLSSALLMATARAMLRQRVSIPGTPADIITDVNRRLVLDTDQTGQFMTLFYAEIACDRNEIHWVRAGHDPAILYNPHTDSFHELKGEGLALGVVPDFNFNVSSRTIEKGQVIVIGTDGIWEMTNMAGDYFGKQALKRIIRSHADKPARLICAEITRALDHFRGSRDTEDDITMVVLRVTEREEATPAPPRI
jgi:sigma-B regulation protein RsbU (phosphoserine phosphatase)